MDTAGATKRSRISVRILPVNAIISNGDMTFADELLTEILLRLVVKSYFVRHMQRLDLMSKILHFVMTVAMRRKSLNPRHIVSS